MSEVYTPDWCSYCEGVTYFEDGFCMDCGKPYWIPVDEWEVEDEETDD